MDPSLDPLAILYSRLPIDAQEIRLLFLHPPRLGCGIECSLVTRRRKDVFDEYYALSYTWGDTTRHEAVSINGICGVSVTDNLFAALGHLRDSKSYKTQKFWVDALCINQNDRTERSLQVQRMREIYSSAKRVFVWLGECNYLEGNAAAISSLKDEWFRQNLHQAVRETVPSWWERIWVWQEYAAARRLPAFCFGKVKIEFSEFENLLRSLHRRSDHSKEQPWEISTTTTVINAKRGHTAIERIASLKNCLDNLEKLRTKAPPSNLAFAEMLQHTAEAEATDARDRIFSLTGFLKPDIADILKPDYSRSIGSVCAAATYADIIEMGVTAALSRVRLSLSRIGECSKPSWAMTFDTYPDFGEYVSKVRFDCSDQYMQDANKVIESIRFDKTFDSLHVLGYRFDSIRQVVEHPSSELPPKYNGLFAKFMAIGKKTGQTESNIDVEDKLGPGDYTSYESQILQFTPSSNPSMSVSPMEAAMINPSYRPWISASLPADHTRRIKRELRSLLQQRRQWMREPWQEWEEDFKTKLSDIRSKSKQRIDIGASRTHEALLQILRAKADIGDQTPKHWTERLNFGLYHYTNDITICPVNFMRYADAAMGRCVVFATDAGCVGVAPSSITENDLVTVLRDSTIPAILRRVDDHYTFQGLAYVHGIMHGEISKFEPNPSNAFEYDRFEIR